MMMDWMDGNSELFTFGGISYYNISEAEQILIYDYDKPSRC